MLYLFIWLTLILQRFIELLIAKRNEKWMKSHGAIIVEDPIYKWIILTHVTFFCSLLLEGYYTHQFSYPMNHWLLAIFMLLQILRFWCLFSLGRFWNTKIIVLPKVQLIKKGLYKYVRHPNYILVGLEFLIIPMFFYAYLTSIIFPFLHIFLMSYRIPMEEKALKGQY
jgi:methyltransferase